jgi:hypothetical protein
MHGGAWPEWGGKGAGFGGVGGNGGAASGTTTDAQPWSHAPVLFKLALSNEQCGALIGKGGRVISQLQTTRGCSIKLSASTDLVPGTAFRSAAVRGSWQAIRGVLYDAVVVLHQVRAALAACGTTQSV